MLLPYFTTEEARAALSEMSPDDDINIAEDALAIADFIDAKLGMSFRASDDAFIRYFYAERDANGYLDRSLKVGAFSSLVDLVVKTDDNHDGTAEITWAAGDYQPRPLNRNEGQPYNELYVPTWSTKGGWPADTLIEVTAAYGYASVPMGIKRAAIELLGIWEMKSPRATRVVNDLAQVVSTSWQAQNIVNELLMTFHPTGIVVA